MMQFKHNRLATVTWYMYLTPYLFLTTDYAMCKMLKDSLYKANDEGGDIVEL